MNHISIEKDTRHTDCKRHHNAYPATPQGILIKGGSPDTKAAKTVQGLMEPLFPKQMSNFYS